MKTLRFTCMVLSALLVFGSSSSASHAATTPECQTHLDDIYFSQDIYMISADRYPNLNTIICIDFNNDGFKDLIVPLGNGTWSGNWEDPYDPFPLLAFRNDGYGHFVESTSEVLGDVRVTGPVLLVADLSGDGLDDLFVCDNGLDWPPYTGNKYLILVQKSNGTLVDEAPFRMPPVLTNNPYRTGAGDIDGDGDIDLIVVTTGGLYYFLINDGRGIFDYEANRLPPANDDPNNSGSYMSNNFVLLDADKDGDLDLFMGRSGAVPRDRILLNDGTGHFVYAPDDTLPDRLLGTGSSTNASFTADLNGDGWMDLVLACILDMEMRFQILFNNADGTFYDVSHLAIGPYTNTYAGEYHRRIADLNGDGWPDLLMARHIYPGQFPTRLYINHAGTSFEDISATAWSFRDPDRMETPICDSADLDNDGDIDVVGVYPMNEIYVLINQTPYPIPEPALPFPGTPALEAPADGAAVEVLRAPLRWSAVPTAFAYRLQVAADPDFSQVLLDNRSVTSNRYEIPHLTGQTIYYWRVQAINTRGSSPWSAVRSFSTPPTVIISGRVTMNGAGVAGVRFYGFPCPTVSDDEGRYEAPVEAGWSGSVAPAKFGYQIAPPSVVYSGIQSNQTTDYVLYRGIPYAQRQMLIALYTSTNGDAWFNKTGWKLPPLEDDGFAAYGTEGAWYGLTVRSEPLIGLPVSFDKLIGMSLPNNNLAGSLPAGIGDLSDLEHLSLGSNPMGGSLPASLGNLEHLWLLELSDCRFEGIIPPGIGNLTGLRGLIVGSNRLAGPIPETFTNLTNLEAPYFSYNALYTSNSDLRAFLDSKSPGWDDTQTIAPAELTAAALDGDSILLSWLPITYTGDTGYYKVYSSQTAGGPYALVGQTVSKSVSSLQVDGLTPGQTYYFVVQAHTNVHAGNQNAIDSENSAEASATTLAPIIREDFVGTWDGQGVYYRNSDTAGWVKMSSPATMITTGDLDGDGIDDLIGLWPTQGGIWAKYSQSGLWARLSSTAVHIAAGDMNGDGREDLLGTWDGQGVYYRNSITGAWVKLASPATMITTGDIDDDGTDDLIGIWPSQGGVWVKNSQSGAWARLSSTARDIASGDMNGDGRDDLVATWDGQGAYYRNSMTGAWVRMASEATQVTCGDLDADGKSDLIGIWPTQGGVWVKYSQTGAWALLSSTARDLSAGKMRGSGTMSAVPVGELSLPMGGFEPGPEAGRAGPDRSDNGPGGAKFAPKAQKNLLPTEGPSVRAPRRPGPGEPGFKCIHERNSIPRAENTGIKKKDGK